MNANDTLPPASDAEAGAGADELWPTNGPAKGLRVRLPIAIVALAVVGFVGVAAGASLKEPSSSTQNGAVAGGDRGPGNFGANGTPGGTGGRLGGQGGGVFGTVTKVDGNTITVTQADGSTATVVVPSGTTISKTVSGSLSDLTEGTSIVARATTADGKTTAQSVTINPGSGAGGVPGGGFGGGGSGGPNGAPGAGAPTSGTGQ